MHRRIGSTRREGIPRPLRLGKFYSSWTKERKQGKNMCAMRCAHKIWLTLLLLRFVSPNLFYNISYTASVLWLDSSCAASFWDPLPLRSIPSLSSLPKLQPSSSKTILIFPLKWERLGVEPFREVSKMLWCRVCMFKWWLCEKEKLRKADNLKQSVKALLVFIKSNSSAQRCFRWHEISLVHHASSVYWVFSRRQEVLVQPNRLPKKSDAVRFYQIITVLAAQQTTV